MDVEIGDLCWAKMKGFPPWPGKIIEAPHSEKYRYLHKKRLYRYVYFFGSGNFAWVPAANIKPNSEEAINQGSKKKSASLQKAIRQMKKYMPNNFVMQDLEEKYFRQGIIKTCSVSMKRLNVDSSKLRESNSFPLNELKFLGLSDEILQPQKFKITDGAIADAASIKDADIELTTCQEMRAKNFGFIGHGELGKGIVSNLLKSNTNVSILKQTADKYGLSNIQQTADSFLDLIAICDIILCYICSEDKVQSFFQDKDILQSFATTQNEGKGFILLANVDLQVTAKIAASIQASGGTFLVAPLLGSETQALNGDLLILCSGDESLYGDFKAAFKSYKKVKYLGPDTELAPKFHTIIGLFINSVSKSYEEVKTLTQELKLSVETFHDVLKYELGDNWMSALCYEPLEKKFCLEDRIRFFLENLNLKTLLGTNFSRSGFDL